MSHIERRSFHKLTLAAFGGLVAGAAGSVARGAEDEDDDDKKDDEKDDEKEEALPDPALLADEPHVCRGLNTCKGKGADGENKCAGQGSCSSVAEHACNGQNECKGQGGCGGYPGQNACNAKGHCAVPLEDKAWALARKQFEEVMKALGKKVGDAPKG